MSAIAVGTRVRVAPDREYAGHLGEVVRIEADGLLVVRLDATGAHYTMAPEWVLTDLADPAEARLAALEAQVVALRDVLADVLWQVAVRGMVPSVEHAALMQRLRAAWPAPDAD